MTEYVLIVVSPDSEGLGTYPTAMYGPSADRGMLEEAGELLCAGSSGWTFVVASWPLPQLQPPVFGSL